MAAADGGEHPAVAAQRLLNGGLQVLEEHRGGPHVHLPDGGLPLPGDKAGAGQGVLQCGGQQPVVGGEDGVDIFLLQGPGQQLAEQQLGIVLVLVGGVRRQSGEEEDVARRPQPHPVGQIGVPQCVKQLGGGQQAITHKAQGLVRPRAAQQQHPVMAAEDGLAQGLAPGKPGGELCHLFLGGRFLPLELQIPGVQQGLVRGVPEIQAVLIDKVLDHRGD